MTRPFAAVCSCCGSGHTRCGGWFATVDHKEIGLRYLATAFAFLIVGGLEALAIRIQLAGPDAAVLTPEQYDQIFTMHGITMIFWYALPILSGFGNYLIPLFSGARDMAYPRLNAFTYWTFLASGLFLYASPFVGQAPHAGWFAYVPYTLKAYSPGLNMDFFALALLFLTISTTAGAINFVTTILRFRSPGMAISRMPLFFYSTLTISASIVVSLPPLTAALVFLELDRQWGTHFYDTTRGGSAMLWQQLFWFFGHPWVYVIFLPATGMISMILPVFARRPIVGYTWVAFATVLTGFVGFGVWVHHMFTYPAVTGWGGLNLLETVGAFVLAAGILASVVNFFRSLRIGPVAGKNPWNADTLEWDTESPPPVYGSERIPVVSTRHPLWDDFDETFDPDDDRVLDRGRVTVATSALDGVPIAIAKMPDDTMTPFFMAIALTVLFTALLLKSMGIAAVATIACLLVAGAWLWPEPERQVRA